MNTQSISDFKKPLLVIGIIAAAASLLGAFMNTGRFFQSYLVAFIFWSGIGLGAFLFSNIHHLTEGRWGKMIRPYLESAQRTIPFILILFLPLAFGLKHLYLWAKPGALANDAILQSKSFYLNEPFFIARTVGFFLFWIGLSWFISSLHRKHIANPTQKTQGRLKLFSGLGMVGYFFTATFASFDWIMSLTPHWYSTIFGFLFMSGQALLVVGWITIVSHKYSGTAPELKMENKDYHDLGNFLLTCVLLWAYMAFSQFLIIWSGNLPEEIHWYLPRIHGGWPLVTWVLASLHFFVPFFFLLMRKFKQSGPSLVKIALLILVARFIEIYWLIQPAFSHDGISVHWLDATTFIALGGLWMWRFFACLEKEKLTPPQTETLTSTS